MENPNKKSDSFDKLNDSSMKNSSIKDENKSKNSKSELNQSDPIAIGLKVTQITMQEIWAATKPIVHKSKKTYTRKGKKDDTKLDDI